MKDLSIPVVDIHLFPLNQDSVRRIIGDILDRDPDSSRLRDDPEMQTLVELVYAKTQGNPFFVIQLLKTLHRANHIAFDFAENQWRFNLTSMEASDLPPTVVELLAKSMLKLSNEARTAMMLASCIGTDRISLRALSTAAGKRIEQTASDIWGALDAGLVLPTGGNYKIHLALEAPGLRAKRDSPVSSGAPPPARNNGLAAAAQASDTTDEEEATYRFLHDRVRQAAYSLIPPGERAGLHRMIGTRMLEKATEEDLDGGMIYEIVNQLNHWLSPLEPEERRTLMELNLKAGKMALQATAFATAANYLSIAKDVLDDPDGGQHAAAAAAGPRNPSKRLSFGYNNAISFGHPSDALQITCPNDPRPLDELSTEINISLMEGYFADVKYAKSIQLSSEILPNCTKSKDKVRCLITKMNCLLVQGRLSEAIEAGLTGLSVLSWEVPLDDDNAQQHALMMRPRILLDVKRIKAIAKMHRLQTEDLLLIQEIISTLLLPVYMARPALLPAVCFTSVAVTLEFGVSMAGALALVMTGVLLGNDPTNENLERSFAYGQAALKLIENGNSRHPLAPAIYQVYAGHIGIFHQSMQEVQRYLQQAIQAGLAVFNVDYTTFAMVEQISFAMMSGETLDTVHSKMIAAKGNIRRFKQETGMWWLGVPLQLVLNLRGLGNSDPLCFEGEALGASEDLSRLASSESLCHIYMYHMYRLIVSAIYGSIPPPSSSPTLPRPSPSSFPSL